MLPGEDGTMCRVRLDIKYTPHPTREQAALGRLASALLFCANPRVAAGHDAYCSPLVHMIAALLRLLTVPAWTRFVRVVGTFTTRLGSVRRWSRRRSSAVPALRCGAGNEEDSRAGSCLHLCMTLMRALSSEGSNARGGKEKTELYACTHSYMFGARSAWLEVQM